MKEYIDCKCCDSKNCAGCNILILATMLNNGAFDDLMDDHHSIVPSADVVERKRGEWRIAERVKTSGTVIVECSECDAIFEVSMITFGLNYNFCPNCGCRMEGE